MTKKTVFLNGIAVGDVDVGGDRDSEIQAIRTFLEERGLKKEVSRFTANFNAALAFANTAAHIYEQDLQRAPRKGPSIVPFVVNATFSIELYIKSLAERYGTRLTGHKLVQLHKALPAQALKAIAAVSLKCASDRGLKAPDFVMYLERLNNAFVEWRYFYEKEELGPVEIEPTIFVMQVLHEACRSQDA